MSRISVSQDVLQAIASRLDTTSAELGAELSRVLAEVGELERDWTGGRAASLADALGVANKSRVDLMEALQVLATYLRAAGKAYDQLETSVGHGLGLTSHTDRGPAPLLFSLLRDDDSPASNHVAPAWRDESSHQRARALLGVDHAGGLVEWDVSAGGSALVAGSAGSGKTELIRTMICSLAWRLPPTAVGFVLVDFKGGGAFGQLDQLPHVVSSVSALDPGYVHRWLRHLNAEVQRRVRRHQSGAPTRSSPERLLVVMDEFASLRDENEDLLEQLLGIVARGRAVGVQLVLGTQAPAGISVSLRNNVVCRVALRVNSREASLDVLGTAGAELLRQPGSGLVALPGQDLVAFEAPLSTAADVGAVVRATQEAVRERSIPVVTWPPPLPLSVSSSVLSGAAPAATPAVVIGLADDPDRLEQTPLLWEPAKDGHLLILGPPGSGKSHALASIARAVSESSLFNLAIDRNSIMSDTAWISARSAVSVSGLVDQLRTAMSAPRPTVVFVDGLDEISVEPDGDEVNLLLAALDEARQSRVYVAAGTRRSRIGKVALESHFGVVVHLAPWALDDAAPGRPVASTTAHVPGRGIAGEQEVQLVSNA